MAEIELERHSLALCRLAVCLTIQAFLLHHVQADDAEITDILTHQSRDIVIPDQQKIYGHVLAVADELVLALGDLQATALEQIDRVIGQATGFLHRNLYALLGGFHEAVLSGRGGCG